MINGHVGSPCTLKDFVYDSVEHDEPGLVSIRRVSGNAGWRVGSIFQENSESRTWSSEQIARAVRDFVEAVDRWTAEELGVDVDALEIVGFTGVDAPYEPPTDPDLTVHPHRATPAELAERIATVIGQW